MKKIDFHIHTCASVSDTDFEFSLIQLKEYVKTANLDCIAITNHNLFDFTQYKEIAEALDIPVYPGIEVDLEKGHILIIAERNDIEKFSIKCNCVKEKIKTKEDYLFFEDFCSIFDDLSKYFLIPHYDKRPKIHESIIEKLKENIWCGEVASPRKFKYCLKDEGSLVPLFFSDFRACELDTAFPTRHTYIDIGDLTLKAIKMASKDKRKISLSKDEGHDFFEFSEDGLKLSNGLNVILGERSSGKTYTLNKIFHNFDNVKYIRQFELLERNEEADSKRFDDIIGKEQSLFTEEFLKEFKIAVDDMETIDLEKNERDIEKYLVSLLKHAEESDMEDSYAKTKLFTETPFTESDLSSLKKLISSIEVLIENVEYENIIAEFVEKSVLKNLVVRLMTEYIEKSEKSEKRREVNDLVNSIKDELQMHTASTRINDIDLYKIALEKRKSEKFATVVDYIKKERIIKESSFQSFKILVKAEKFKNISGMRNLSTSKPAFTSAFQNYGNPYDFIKELRKMETIKAAEYYRYFTNVTYQVLNKYGAPVSGGERSEFRLLQTIRDSQQHSMLLIDEPESSFDNIFLKNQVNQLIRSISESMPVVIVTHNNTVGASIKPDYIIYTKKVVKPDRNVTYEVYSGHPSDKQLKTIQGKEMRNFEIMINCLEAGTDAYNERSDAYETLKD